jgi:hypothetical protein
MLRARWPSVLSVLCIVGTAFAQHSSPLRKHLLGTTPPELAAGKEQWLAGQPVTLRSLHGRVVWLQFNF